MAMSFFDQFIIPQTLGIPLIIIAAMFPMLLVFTPNYRPTNSRMSALQLWAFKTFSKQLMMPINTPGQKWTALLLTLAFFLLLINLSGLLPYTFTPTTQLSMNMSLAIPMWMATVLTGLRGQLTTSLGHLLPEGTPGPLIPALIIIETISLFIRPLALGVRLTANLTAGHLLLQLISTAIFIVAFTMPTTAVAALVVLILLTLLELAVAMIQAYVFVLLLSLYLQENV